MNHLIVIEPTGTGFSAYSPDLLGCVSTGATLEEGERNMQEAVELHLGGLREEDYPVPESSAYVALDIRTIPGQSHEVIVRRLLECLLGLESEDHAFDATLEVIEERPWTEIQIDASWCDQWLRLTRNSQEKSHVSTACRARGTGLT